MKSPPSCPALYRGENSGTCSNPHAAVSVDTAVRKSLKSTEAGVGTRTLSRAAAKFFAKEEFSDDPVASRQVVSPRGKDPTFLGVQ